jgi:hypothetical protein
MELPEPVAPIKAAYAENRSPQKPSYFVAILRNARGRLRVVLDTKLAPTLKLFTKIGGQ